MGAFPIKTSIQIWAISFMTSEACLISRGNGIEAMSAMAIMREYAQAYVDLDVSSHIYMPEFKGVISVISLGYSIM